MGLLSAWVFWSIWLAYRHYLRMPHGFGVALASAVIAWLVVTVVMLLPALVSG